MDASGSRSVVAVLGPTNTGKTHRAVERMLEHPTGMIGLPLRLLAREVYDRVSARVGELAVALVTGEEKRLPPRARYWICTVEAMPLDRPVDFLAVDEIQLCAHPQRGHVFTDRLLHARGLRETWFLGADAMAGVLEELVPVAAVRRHPRFSKLSAVGAVHLASLPPRSALIAFSAAEVYQLADRLRGRRGGAAVVLGALSPRTRNAQVAMYQAGEVDYLVATDAIGMGLNMDLDHVAFASLTKFDGRESRALAPQEVAQIAGRAGRHLRDGTFGALSPLELDRELVFSVENHRFAPVRRVVWRNSDLDLSSLDALVRSLDERPRRRVLELVERADDAEALRALAARPEIAALATGRDAVRLLWEVCGIPDFRRLLAEHHASLLGEIFLALVAGGGRLAPDFMDGHVRRLESDEGDLDTLVMRLELVRTWRYVAHRAAWHDDPASWQARTERAEDAIGDALHRRLLERFVDRTRRRRHAHAPRARRVEAPTRDLAPPAPSAGPFAVLAGLRAAPALQAPGDEAAADDLVDAVVEAPFEAFELDESGVVAFEGERLGQLVRGADRQHPEVKLLLARHVGAGRQAMLLRRLRAHARDVVRSVLAPLDATAPDSPFAEASPRLRGLLHRLAGSLGTLRVDEVRAELDALSDEDRARLARGRIRRGRRALYAEATVDAASVRRRAALATAFLELRPAIPLAGGALAVPRARAVGPATYLACGYLDAGPLVLRVDACEALLDELDGLAASGPFRCPPELAGALGRPRDELESSLVALGFTETEAGFVPPGPARGRRSGRGSRPS